MKVNTLRAQTHALRPASLVAMWLLVAAGSRAPAETPRHTITCDHDCYQVDGRDVYMYSGSIHYMRCPRELWADRLLKIKRAGFNTVQTIIPWNYHEPEEGRLDLSELETWLDLCQALGFYVNVRPGPFICGEWDNGGFPDWLVPRWLHLRSNNEDYLKWVAAWYDRVLPVLRKRQVTRGGCVFLVQLENEYGGDAEYKAEAIRKMYRMVRQRGIDVPLFTCNTPCAEDNDDPVMREINNGWDVAWCRWATAESKVAKNIRRVRQAEYNMPSLGADIPGGGGLWAAYVHLPQTGSWRIPPLDWRDFDVTAKTVWMEGAAQSNYFMLFGGTNFGYTAASYMSTSYWNRAPVQCPLLEPGGLWETYYAVKLWGQWLQLFGTELVRASPCPEGALAVEGDSTKPPHGLQRNRGDKAFLFLRDQQDAAQQIRVSYTDPGTGQRVTVPSKGRLTLAAREMRALVANVPLAKLRMQYATSEILGIRRSGPRTVVVLHGPLGTPGEVRLLCPVRPQVSGAAEQTWDDSTRTLTLHYTHDAEQRCLAVDDVLLVIVDRRRAYTTWDLSEDAGGGFLVSDCYFLRDAQKDASGVTLSVECLPGKAQVATFLAQQPRSVHIDGAAVPFRWDKQTGEVCFAVVTKEPPDVSHQFKRARFMRDGGEGKWQATSLRSLEDLGVLDKGYVRYRTSFQAEKAATLLIRYFEGSSKGGRSHQTVGDPAMVFINGKYVAQASGWHARKIALAAAEWLTPGENTIEVILEKIGRPCGAGGWGMNEPKGLAAVTLVGPAEDPWTKVLDAWQLSVGLEGQQQGFHRPEFDDSAWPLAKLGDWKKWIPGCETFDGIGWYRVEFDARVPPEWIMPLKLCLKANTDALLYLNGRIIGRYNGIGWQREFFLPDGWLVPQGRNVLAVAVRNAGQVGGLSEIAVQPYSEFGVQRHRIAISCPE